MPSKPRRTEALGSGRDLSEELADLHFHVRLHRRARLDLHLQQCLGWKSRTKVQKLIQMGRVKVNGEVAKAAQRIGDGDHIHVALVREGTLVDNVEQNPLPPPFWEDPFLLAVDKPPGRLVHPTGRTLTGTIMNEIHHRYRSCNQVGLRGIVAKLCHRLDRDTSGVLLIAKTDPARRKVQFAFEENRVRKEYLAIVEGEPIDDEFEVDLPVSVQLDRRRATGNRLASIGPEGKSALTRFQVLDRLGGTSLIRCLPRTGRQNQIRVHLAATGHPILGDTGYGSSSEFWAQSEAARASQVPFPERALLHSASLQFPHPIWRTQCRLRAGCPADFTVLLPAGLVIRPADFASVG